MYNVHIKNNCNNKIKYEFLLLISWIITLNEKQEIHFTLLNYYLSKACNISVEYIYIDFTFIM